MTGCLLRIVLLPLSIAALYPLFCLRAPFPTFVLGAEGAEIAALIAGVFTWWVLISWLDIRQTVTTLALARDWTLQDGERTVIAGHVEARNATLTAPFSGQKCLAYRYTVSHHARHADMKTTEWTDFEGIALAPSIVRGPMRTLNVLARPQAELFAEVPALEITRDEDWARAEAYLTSTDFGEMPRGPLADTRARLIDNGPGDFREDKQVRDPPKNLQDYKPAAGSTRLEQGQRRLTEAIVHEGDRVMMAGVYRAADDGIAPDPDDIMHPFHIVVGGEAPLKRKIRNRWIGIVIAATLAAVTAAVYFGVFVPRSG
ncbi:MAG: hypothetical protein OEQ39_16445 [Gammaproteobacteria bacterium]|nr:hypothetical protein [Gammaproteobacteria bacterium]MDH3466865.1 hypothetical protein [Gammaproteobacteria bacterium]